MVCGMARGLCQNRPITNEFCSSLVDFTPVHCDLRRSRNADANSVTLDVRNFDADAAVDHNLFTKLATKDQHEDSSVNKENKKASAARLEAARRGFHNLVSSARLEQ
jgi:hypothetical protein